MRFTCTRCEGTGTIGEEKLQRVQSRVLNAVRAAKTGIALQDLIVEVYGEKCPRRAENSMHVTIKNLNHRSAHLKIVADKKGPGARYRLVTAKGGRHADRTDHRDVHRRRPGRDAHGLSADREKE